ncbi:MAG TPA: hypothetical protein VL358_09805 [Caulobacteraceae bacterium]|jgi:hypothetical protein|nr:hypothetical protein [Caulobacteraceae bacterium]
MTADPKADTPDVNGQAPTGQPLGPAFAADEAQPSSAISERDALSEREDGTNRGGPEPVRKPTGPAQDDAFPTIVLTADEQQPISALDEHNALSEREDGTNRG